MARTCSASREDDPVSVRHSGLAERCRVFYERRRAAAATFGAANESGTAAKAAAVGATSLGRSMLLLRREMATLMEEDNALLQQLLNLHDAIEDLKEQQQRALRETSRTSSLDSLSEDDPEVMADQSASPTSTLSSASSSSSTSVASRLLPLPPHRFFRVAAPPSSGTAHHRTSLSSSSSVAHRDVLRGGASRPLQIVAKDAQGRLVVLRPTTTGDLVVGSESAFSPYDSGFHGSESDAENNEIFV